MIATMNQVELINGRYLANRCGTIHSTLSGRDLKPAKNSKGYMTVQLYDGSIPKKPKSYLVHRLICEAFNGEPPDEKSQVNHKDGNKQNNSADNLEWTTPLENVRHSIEVLGIHRLGEQNSNHRITADEILLILESSLSSEEVARRIGCSGGYVRSVRRRHKRADG